MGSANVWIGENPGVDLLQKGGMPGWCRTNVVLCRDGLESAVWAVILSLWMLRCGRCNGKGKCSRCRVSSIGFPWSTEFSGELKLSEEREYLEK